MYVVVQHQTSDPAAFLTEGQKMLRNVPVGLTPRFFLPNAQGTEAVCLWEAGSEEALRSFIDGRLGQVSANRYFAVDARNALGIPVPAAARV